MPKSLSTFNFKQLPLACLMVLITLIACELFVRSSVFFNAPADQIVEKKTKFLNASTSHQFDVLIMGDSRLLELDAERISQSIQDSSQTKMSIYNFSFPNMGIRSYTVFLKKYLKRHEKPKYILFESMPLMLTGDWDIVGRPTSSAELHRFLKVFSFFDYYRSFPSHYLSKMIIKSFTEMSHFYTYGERVRDFLKKMVSREEFDAREIQIDLGGRLLWTEATRIVSDESVSDSYAMTKEFTINASTVEWYHRFFELAQLENIQVIMFSTPLPQVIHAKRDLNGVNKAYEDFILSVTGQYPNVTFIEPIAHGSPQDLFRDPTHLNEKGADHFSEELGNRMGTFLSAQRKSS